MQRQILAIQSPYINKLRAADGEGFLHRETKKWSQPNGSNAMDVYLSPSLLKLQFILEWFMEARYLKDLDQIDGELMSPSGKISKIDNIGNYRRGSEDHD